MFCFCFISHVTTSEIKLKQNCFVSVLFQFYFRCNHCFRRGSHNLQPARRLPAPVLNEQTERLTTPTNTDSLHKKLQNLVSVTFFSVSISHILFIFIFYFFISSNMVQHKHLLRQLHEQDNKAVINSTDSCPI